MANCYGEELVQPAKHIELTSKAIKELEGMGYSITPKVIKSEFTDTYSVCVTVDSPWFGSFGTAKQLPGDSSLDDINKAKAKLVIGLWKQARERLLLGQLVA